jgi:HipA-like protein
MLTHLGNEALIFTFDPTYIDAGSDRPILSLGFKAADGDLVEQTRPTRVRLPPFFSNLLPEAHLREYLAARGRVHPEREFFLIWLLGADLPGAVVVRSVDDAAPPADDESPTRTHVDEQPFRFSLAGVQLKFSALMETSQGLTLPVAGVGGDWIVKLPSPRFEAVPENEYAMMTLAKAVAWLRRRTSKGCPLTCRKHSARVSPSDGSIDHVLASVSTSRTSLKSLGCIPRTSTRRLALAASLACCGSRLGKRRSPNTLDGLYSMC